MASVALGAGASAAFWLVAASHHTSADVGRASGLFTSVLFVCFATGMGLPVAVGRFAAGQAAAGPAATRDEETGALLSWAMAAAAAMAVLGALAYLGVVRSPAIDVVVGRGFAGMALFAAAAAGGSLTLLVDVRLMAARRWSWVVARVAVVGTCQVLLLTTPDPLHAPDLWLFIAAAGPTAVSGVVGAAILPLLVGQRYRFRRGMAGAAPMVRFASVNYLSTLALEAPRFVLPVIVMANVGPSENANFYVAWAVVAVVLLVPTGLAQVMLVEASRGEVLPGAQVRVMAVVGMVVMGVAWMAAVALRGLVPLLYGPDYRSAGDLIAVLMAAGVPWALTSLVLADVRARGDTAATLALTLALTAAVLVPAVLLVPSHGAAGAVGPWVAGNVVVAAAALVVLARSRPSARVAFR